MNSSEEKVEPGDKFIALVTSRIWWFELKHLSNFWITLCRLQRCHQKKNALAWAIALDNAISLKLSSPNPLGVIHEKALLLLWCCVCNHPCMFTPQGLSYQLLIVTRLGFICTHICNEVAQLRIHHTPFPSLIIGCSWFLHARILGNPSYIFKYTPSFLFR